MFDLTSDWMQVMNCFVSGSGPVLHPNFPLDHITAKTYALNHVDSALGVVRRFVMTHHRPPPFLDLRRRSLVEKIFSEETRTETLCRRFLLVPVGSPLTRQSNCNNRQLNCSLEKVQLLFDSDYCVESWHKEDFHSSRKAEAEPLLWLIFFGARLKESRSTSKE